MVVCAVVFAFYTMLNQQSGWSSLISALVFDGSVSYIGLFIILTSPSGTALGQHRENFTSGSKGSAVSAEARESLVEGNTEIGEMKDSAESAICRINRQIRISVSPSDSGIVAYITIAFLAWLSSCISDLIANDHNASPAGYAFLVIGDTVENFLYMVPFLVPPICYRVLSLRVRALTAMIKRELAEGDDWDTVTGTSCASSIVALRIARSKYEDIFHDVEKLNSHLGASTLLSIALAALEMASTLQIVFAKRGFEITWENAEFLRLLVVIGVSILQLVYAAADVVHASEKLAETLAQKASLIRQGGIESMLEGGYGSTGIHSRRSGRTRGSEAKALASASGDMEEGTTPTCDDIRLLSMIAKSCETFGDRVNGFPIRISMSW
eukprot:CAMPEP_0184499594 /NCGR_PEP_ID=MMETSP0113_2-20130426/41898_1 /TAXON_ID=91329 /ORGANISM="Norrisiella sphaerica, Strain BC52" /LENGTH=382 /DNA_ID=CAMNT_0026887551 /DNA_START=42 /DNA_END=1187 /DNA_ORIENTATION=+